MEIPRRCPSRRQRRSVPRTDHAAVACPRSTATGTLRFPLKQQALDALVREALDEDGAFNDLTTIATVVSDRRARATLVARETGVVCGVPLALEAFRLLDPKVVDARRRRGRRCAWRPVRRCSSSPATRARCSRPSASR